MLSELFLDGRHGSTDATTAASAAVALALPPEAPDREPADPSAADPEAATEPPNDSGAAPDALWQSALLALSSKVSAQNFDLWFRPIRCAAIRGAVIHLLAPNRFIREWFETNYLGIVLSEIGKSTSLTYTVSWEVLDSPLVLAEPKAKPPSAPVARPAAAAPRRDFLHTVPASLVALQDLKQVDVLVQRLEQRAPEQAAAEPAAPDARPARAAQRTFPRTALAPPA